MELWLLTLDLSRCLGQELCSFCALLFCLVFVCGMGCMNLSLLVKVSVLLKLGVFGGLRTYRLFAFTHVVFGLVFLGGVLVGSHVCFFSTWGPALETCYAVSVSP